MCAYFMKSDKEMLRNLSLGVIGTRKVMEHLRENGHQPIEFERGALSYKLWKGVKIKRQRVPDLICVNCGLRVESRAKSVSSFKKLRMSHSLVKSDRSWDAGLKDDDIVAVIRCTRIGDGPTDWAADDIVHYIPVKGMREAYEAGVVKQGARKGTEAGSELTLEWPISVATVNGIVREKRGKHAIDPGDGSRPRPIRLRSPSATHMKQLTIPVGSEVKEGQIVAASMPVLWKVPCDKRLDPDDIVKQLRTSSSWNERYAAAKVLQKREYDTRETRSALLSKLDDSKEDHIFVRLEAAASLLRLGVVDKTITFLREVLTKKSREEQMETVIVLGEVGNEHAKLLVEEILDDKTKHEDIRAAAAWVLGEINNPSSIETLVKVFNDKANKVRENAVKALKKICVNYSAKLIYKLDNSHGDEQAGIAWSITQGGSFSFKDLINKMSSDDTRKWVAWILGHQQQQQFESEIGQLKNKDPEVHFAVTVLWHVLSSWVADIEDDEQ